MLFKFTLSHIVLGDLVISEPSGWTQCKLKLERHEDYHSLIEYFEGEFVFYGDNGVQNGGIDFIREVESIYGPDAELGIKIEISPDNITYQTVFIGQLDLWNIEEMPDNKAQVPIIRNDFWAKFINRLDTPVDIQSERTLDDEQADVFESINLHLPAQKIRQNYQGEFNEGYLTYNTGTYTNQYVQVDFVDQPLNEINVKSNLPLATNPEVPVWIFEMDFDGRYVFDLRIEASAAFLLAAVLGVPVPTDDLTNGGDYYVKYYVQINADAPIELTKTDFDNGVDQSTVYTWASDNIFTKGTIVRVYGLFGASDLPFANVLFYWGKDNAYVTNNLGIPSFTFREVPSGADNPTYLSVTADTTYPDSNAFTFLLHDVGGQILDRITSTDQAFYSEFLGSEQTLYRQYQADGCAWKYALLKGLQIRRYSLIEKPFFISFKQWWEGANPILNLGLGYETIAGDEVIRIEDKRHFYDASEVSVNIDNVRDIVRKYDDSRIFKSVKIGYKKWQSEDVSGIDDPQSKHTYASILKKAGKEITLESEFIAASLAIETTRRKTREKSADYKFDNDTFIIAISPTPVDVSPETSPDVTDYEPELDENYSSITNLLNAETRYNIGLTPARNLLRWLDWLSGCLQAYLSTTFKFTSGEGNYDMTSVQVDVSDGCEQLQDALSEKEDLPVSADPFHLAMAFEINCPLDWEDYILIQNNRKKPIGISQTNENHVRFFIKNLEYEVVKGTVKIEAWPVELMGIDVIETTTHMEICAPAVPCEDAYLTEDGFEYITEDGECLILN